MRLAIVTGIWKRYDIFKIWCDGINKLIQNAPDALDIEVIVAGSEGIHSRTPVEANGYTYIETSNYPLSEKMNKTIIKAKELQCDYVLCLGSDDIITVDLLHKYYEYMQGGYDYVGLLDFYFYDTITKKALYWAGYNDKRRGQTCGAGRMLSSWLLDKIDWRLWTGSVNKGLDSNMANTLKNIPHRATTLKLKDLNLYAVDIKSEYNVTPFRRWVNSYYVDAQELLYKLGIYEQ